MTDEQQRRAGPMRKAFEQWISRSWHKSWREHLTPNKHGAYPNWDINQTWIGFQAGWRRSRR